MEEKNRKEIREEIKNLRLGNITLLRKNPKTGLKICTKKALESISIILPLAITALLLKTNNATPFYMDEIESCEHVVTEYHTGGEAQIVYKYYENSNDKSTSIVLYNSAWEKNEDNTYSRMVSKYKIKDITLEEIQKMESEGNYSFGITVNNNIETKNNVLDEELNRGPYIDVIINTKNEDNKVMVRESDARNIYTTVLWAASSTILAFFSNCIYLNLQDKKPLDKLYEEDEVEEELKSTIYDIKSLKKRMK